jgi:hypothetical protein
VAGHILQLGSEPLAIIIAPSPMDGQVHQLDTRHLLFQSDQTRDHSIYA